MPYAIEQNLQALIDREPLVPKRKPRQVRFRKRKDTYYIDPTRLDECGESELVAISHLLGFENTSRAMTRDDLIELILGEAEEELGVDILSDVRTTIHAYVNGNRSLISPVEMRCDLHCPTCPHQRVVECYTVNQDLVE